MDARTHGRTDGTQFYIFGYRVQRCMSLHGRGATNLLLVPLSSGKEELKAFWRTRRLEGGGVGE